ncbi:AcrR family transcriptional regulator [Bradyrhizobium diazoefficiens]
MSRVRTRPTRDDTRDKLFEAAARVFEEDGIGGASIEAIAAAAGFTRGAFYSNFNSKDELIIAMLEDHVEQSIRRNMDILAQHDNLDDFIAALRTMDRSRQDPLGRSPLLHMEMILYVARAEKRRPELANTPARAAQADRRHRRGDVEEQRQEQRAQPALDGLRRAGAGRRLSPAPADRSRDDAGRQFSARDYGSAAEDGAGGGVTAAGAIVQATT